MEKLHPTQRGAWTPLSPRPRRPSRSGEEWAAEGAKTAASWIATRVGWLIAGAAKRRVRLGRTLRHLPAVAGAWRDGTIGTDQARAIARARRHRTEAAMARDEEMLVAQAEELGFEDFTGVLEPTGSSWPTPTVPRPPTRSARPPAMSSSNRAWAACGWAG